MKKSSYDNFKKLESFIIIRNIFKITSYIVSHKSIIWMASHSFSSNMLAVLSILALHEKILSSIALSTSSPVNKKNHFSRMMMNSTENCARKRRRKNPRYDSNNWFFWLNVLFTKNWLRISFHKDRKKKNHFLIARKICLCACCVHQFMRYK